MDPNHSRQWASEETDVRKDRWKILQGCGGTNTPLRRVVSGFQGAQDGVTEGAAGVQRGSKGLQGRKQN